MASARHNSGPVISIPIRVVVARESSSHPWQDNAWRPIGLRLDDTLSDGWTEVLRSEGAVHYLAATTTIVLRPDDALGYRINLANGEPVIYVVLQDTPCGAGWPVQVRLVTASPIEVRSLGEQAQDTVHRVAMPEALVERLRSFLDGYHPIDELR